MEPTTALIKYIYLDIVKFSQGRTVEAQSDIINTMNRIVLAVLKDFSVQDDQCILLPTGDGICIALINKIDIYDIHLKISLKILENLLEYNKSQEDSKRKFRIRIGINENYDNLITDINNRKNVAGAGINNAQRIMDSAGESQIFVGESVWDKLVQREIYFDKFIKYEKIIKHNIVIKCFRYVNSVFPYLDSDHKDSVQTPKKLPDFVANYFSIAKILEKETVKYNIPGSKSYSTPLLLVYLTRELLDYKALSDVEKSVWSSRIKNETSDTFRKFFQRIDNSHFQLILDGFDFYLKDYHISEYSKYFNNYNCFLLSKEGEKRLNDDWPGLLSENVSLISSLYPTALVI